MIEEIEFSDKYQPLFELLTSWEEVDRLQAKDLIEGLTEEEQQELAYQLQLKGIDTVLMSGGRDSGKSFGLSTFNVVASRDYNHRILCTRQTMSSTDNSIKDAIENRIELLGYEGEFVYASHDFDLKDPDKPGKITITGQKTSSGTQTAKLKSIENYSIFETDEGEELPSYEDWLKVKRSLRAQDVQCLAIIAFNPPTREHWLAEEFYEGVPDGFNGIIDNKLYIHTTYLDNGEENMAEHNWKEYEELRLSYERYEATPKEQRELLPKKLKKAWEKYKYDILGSFRLKAEGVIYEDYEIGEFDRSLPSLVGLDFGSNDPDACVEVAVDEDRKRIYIDELFFMNNLSTAQLYQVLDRTVGKSKVIIADSAGKRSIRDIWDQGFEIEKCLKKQVDYDIKTLQGYTFVTTQRSVNVRKALNNYHWAVSKAGVPDHDWSDLPDAIRYAAIYIIRGGRGGGVI